MRPSPGAQLRSAGQVCLDGAGEQVQLADDLIASRAHLMKATGELVKDSPLRAVWGDIHVTLTPEGSGSTCITARAMAFPNLFALIFSPERRILDLFARGLQ